MARNHKKVAALNLTSLMDVFTILVFFLLVNSASTEVLSSPKQIVLPASAIEQKPRETVVIFISPSEVTLQGDRARCWIVVDGKPTRGVMQFALEDGSWKFDLEFAMRASAGLIAAFASQAGRSEDSVIFDLLSQGSGRLIGPDIWKPLADK